PYLVVNAWGCPVDPAAAAVGSSHASSALPYPRALNRVVVNDKRIERGGSNAAARTARATRGDRVRSRLHAALALRLGGDRCAAVRDQLLRGRGAEDVLPVEIAERSLRVCTPRESAEDRLRVHTTSS